VNCVKRRYRSENDRRAAKHIRSLRKRGFENLHVYHCDKCGAWHVGHIPGAPKKLTFLFGEKE